MQRPASTPSRAKSLLEEASERVGAVEPRAFLVEPRVVRRVIKAEVNLPALTVQVPHRKTWLAERNTLIKKVEPDELGVQTYDELPDQPILIQRPSDRAVEERGLEWLLGRYWRLLYHARVDLKFRQLRERDLLDHRRIRERVHRLGQAEFDEVTQVLRHEGMLLEDASIPDAYSEFAAVYAELRAFAPHCLPAYFPSLQDPERVEALLAEDLDLDALLDATRPGGAPDAVASEDRVAFDETDAELAHLTGRAPKPGLAAALPGEVRLTVARAGKPSPRRVKRYQRRAARASSRGNSVAAALLLECAARHADPARARSLCDDAQSHLRRLVGRLQMALDFDDATGERWYRSVVGLARNSGREFWNAEKRLLHDLQKVCVDHERETSKVSVARWLKSFGRASLVRKLPNQREVLMSKHLATATRRLVASGLSGAEREDLGHLLGEAADSAEHKMRQRLRPPLRETLREVGLTPATVPEEVAFDKLVEELLDQVVAGGFLTMGHLRDGLSRSHLGLEDLQDPREVVLGDRLLRADRALPHSLDGVYRRSDVYLRMLQRATAVVFGNPAGRFVTRFVLMPFGAAYLTFEASLHLAEGFAREGSARLNWVQAHTLEIVGSLGLFALLLIHVDAFRSALWSVIRAFFSVMKRALWDLPSALLRLPLVRSILRAWPVRLVRNGILWPLVPTSIICGLLPLLIDRMPEQGPVQWAVVLLAMSVVLNSRVGRDVEELGQEWLYSAWRRVRVNLVLALFAAIMDTFKRLLEVFERLLYAVDEWLRFKSGESAVSLAFKAVLGMFWSVFTYVTRFVVNLLVEPQINPIKHFPIVTISHKLLLPLAPAMIDLLAGFDSMSREGATAIVTPVIFLFPGVIGFAAWELKSNWRLYRANRSRNLRPLVVGSHGESFTRLLKPGFHSGTLPRLFRKLRRIDRRRRAAEHSVRRSRALARVHHVHEAVERFVERELLTLLHALDAFAPEAVLGRLRLASNSVRVELDCASRPGGPLELHFEEQSGWLIAGVARPGWAEALSASEAAVLVDALAGFYRMAGVDLVREHVEGALDSPGLPYDVREEGIVVWPDDAFGVEVRYNLARQSTVRPTPRSAAKAWGLPTVAREEIVFAHTPISRDAWEARWASGGSEATPLMPAAARWTWGPAEDAGASEAPPAAGGTTSGLRG